MSDAGPSARRETPPQGFGAAADGQVVRPVGPAWAVGLAAVAAVVYFGVPRLTGERLPPIHHFPHFAGAFLQGRLSVGADSVEPLRFQELIPSVDGTRFYLPYPPLPAVLLMPLVAVFGSAVAPQLVCRGLSVVNVVVFDACMGPLARRLGYPEPTPAVRIALDALFGFGTATWHNAMMGGDWHLAHAVALCAMLLALREGLRRDRPAAIGLFIALALLARPTAALTGWYFVQGATGRRRPRDLARLAAAPALAVILLGALNLVRFGDPLDFGYERMLLAADGRRLMSEYGQFHPHFIGVNAFWFFVAPPWPMRDLSFPWLGYDPRGMGLFIASPALLYAVAALRRGWDRADVRRAATAIVMALVPLLLYFNTGFWQFGHRFSLDYLPVLMILVVAGMRGRLSPVSWCLILVSVGFQYVGVLLDPVTRLPASLTPGA